MEALQRQAQAQNLQMTRLIKCPHCDIYLTSNEEYVRHEKNKHQLNSTRSDTEKEKKG